MRELFKAGLRRFVSTPARTKTPMGDRHATVIAVAAQKGGVGKTTTAVSLAAALARNHQQKVLLVDLDAQGHTNTALKSVLLGGGGALSDLLANEGPSKDLIDIAAPTRIPQLFVTPRDPRLAPAEDALGGRLGKEFLLREAMVCARTHFDVILLDCPPNLGNLTVNGLVAADYVLVPCDPSPLSLQGVEALVQSVGAIAMRLNPDLDLLGVLPTRVDGRNRTVNTAVMRSLHERFGDSIIPTAIGVDSKLARAQMDGKDIFDFDPEARSALQYQALASWTLGELARQESSGQGALTAEGG